jgi:hypothetical protein
LKAAVVCGSPWNLETSSVALQRTWMGLGVYSRAMGSNMKKLFELYAKEALWLLGDDPMLMLSYQPCGGDIKESADRRGKSEECHVFTRI